MHPAAWLIWAACATLVAVSTTDPFYLVTLAAVAWFVSSVRRTDGSAGRSMRVFAIAAGVALVLRTSLVLFTSMATPEASVAGDCVLTTVRCLVTGVSLEHTVAAALEGARLAALLLVYGAFNTVTDPYGIIRLAPSRFYEVSLAAALSLSLAPRTIDAAVKIREAQRLRGIDVGRVRAVPALALPVLATGMESAVTLAESMDARGHGRGRRSRYRPDRWTLGAAIACLLAVVAAGCFIWASWFAGVPLHPSTYPLAWPETSPALVAAICLLAAPGLLPIGGNRR